MLLKRNFSAAAIQFKPVGLKNGIHFQQRKDKHKLILNQQYFLDLKSHLEE